MAAGVAIEAEAGEAAMEGAMVAVVAAVAVEAAAVAGLEAAATRAAATWVVVDSQLRTSRGTNDEP